MNTYLDTIAHIKAIIDDINLSDEQKLYYINNIIDKDYTTDSRAMASGDFRTQLL